MSVNVCPIGTVYAPLERVWALLSEPANYALWWDATTRSITPEGHAAPGQMIEADTRALGMRWKVHIAVNSVDETRHALGVTSRLPLGITGHNHITVTPLDSASVRVSFG
jgi:hypothetical protein